MELFNSKKQLITKARVLKRVPLDFNAPLNEEWRGYSPRLDELKRNKLLIEKVPQILEYDNNVCASCGKINPCDENAKYCILYNKELRPLWFQEVPEGEGYQLWSTVSDSPKSPVFVSLEELSEWCKENATMFANLKATKEEWLSFFNSECGIND